MRYDWAEVTELVGKTLTSINVENGKDEIYFETSDGETYHMWHMQDCCEDVKIEDIIGDLDDLIGTPITMAEEITEACEDEEWGDSVTWTFYKFATNKGYVTIRWYGSSNGYYSESVDFSKLKEAKRHET
jgi:hypothetical protein